MSKLELMPERASTLSEDPKVSAAAESSISKHLKCLCPIIKLFSVIGTYIRTNDGRIFAIRSGKLGRGTVGDHVVPRGKYSVISYLIIWLFAVIHFLLLCAFSQLHFSFCHRQPEFSQPSRK